MINVEMKEIRAGLYMLNHLWPFIYTKKNLYGILLSPSRSDPVGG
jgi:hypothetical protein